MTAVTSWSTMRPESRRRNEATMTERRVRAYVGLGANVGDAAETLAWAVNSLGNMPGVRLRAVSPLYVTAPWGVTDQPDFHNAVVAIEVPAGPDPAAGAIALLGQLKTLERLAGRRRRARWGPRELDLDLLVFGRHRVTVDRPAGARSLDAGTDPAKAARRLEVPHRDAGERLFVLAPLADLAPGLVPPGWHHTVATRRREVAAAEPAGAVRQIGGWGAESRSWRRSRGTGRSPSGRSATRLRIERPDQNR
jgi:2-amino-4-hydroxy-6-hydroxymethyldihydropteridine diphosphokinase